MLDALSLAAVLEEIGPPTPGRAWTAVCAWCLERADPQHVAPARRAHGDCLRCAYTGRDTFVALLPLPAP